MPYLSIFGLEFKKTSVIFLISIIEFAKFQNCVKKQKFLNLGWKMIYLGLFGLELKKKLLS